MSSPSLYGCVTWITYLTTLNSSLFEKEDNNTYLIVNVNINYNDSQLKALLASR